MALRNYHRRNPQIDVDSLFPDDGREREGIISFEDLPYITRPIVEYLHNVRPSVVIAGDRGGRLFGLSAFYSWKKRFPGEPFPTLDGKLHFARVSSRSAEKRDVKRAVHFTLRQAGLTDSYLHEEAAKDGSSRKVVFMDDWAVHGGTFGRFLDAVKEYGVPKTSVAYATMCGKRVYRRGVEHIIGDESRAPRNSDWNDRSYYAGVTFPSVDSVTPYPNPNKDSMWARNELIKNTDAYYARFTAALVTGKITVQTSVLVAT